MEPESKPHGIINLDKPAGVSSARMVGRVKRLLVRGTKIGHAGTLDPFATGVLLLLVGKSTKLCEQLMDAPKQYEAAIKLGATTATDDLDSPEQPFGDGLLVPSSEAVADALSRFVGEILQRPPAFSALKVGGRRAYDLARKGQAVQLTPRRVKVYGAELLEYQWPLARVRIDCGRGTYIRAIARDVGVALGVGGYLTELRRTRVGPFDVARAVCVESLTADTIAGQLQLTTSFNPLTLPSHSTGA
ncbi:MAG TPA: tRNA pseudouridine(55) synthase TruB [Tepidisphaeraceae bacterium]|nr:tRNA pseudouridine(55) synthase TruB [Tepidisphaeraceae bacterium]